LLKLRLQSDSSAAGFAHHASATGNLTMPFARPPVQGRDFEMDVSGVAHELVI
jgi:hypothetical protein